MSPPTIRTTQGNTASQAQGPQYAKVFVQRDYSDGTAVKFMTNFPQGLENKASFCFYSTKLLTNYNINFIFNYRLRDQFLNTQSTS